MPTDPIVDEVRAIRERLAAPFDFDVRRIVKDAQRRQAESTSKIVSFEVPKGAPPSSIPATTSHSIASRGKTQVVSR